MSSERSPEHCFHCGLTVARGRGWSSGLLGETRDFCCAGCQAAAEAIVGNGLEAYYGLRTAPAPTASSEDSRADRLFDREDLQRSFVRTVGGHREASLLLEGVRCPACLWLNERRLRALPGVIEAAVAYASRSARVRWDPSRVALSQILAAVREIGYEARPMDPSHRAGLEREAARRDIPRLVFAGVLGMMVMNLSLAAYFLGGPDAAGRLPLWETFARWACLAGAAVLLGYCGQDFFVGAWRDLRQKRAGMDVPVALGLAAAWIGSAVATVRGSGAVYGDAIAMLVFFVLLARAFETRARLAAAAVLDRFALIQPTTARRVDADGREREVAALDLAAGDLVRVRPGEIVPADAILLEAPARFDQAVLTGEPWPRMRGPGDEVVAGSCARDHPALLRVLRAGEASALAEIRRLLERGLASRPRFAQLADRLAGPLVGAVLALSAATATWWAVHDAAVVLPATVAVLIVTCPCALALATPMILTVAAGRLAQIGVLPARMAGIERLGRAETAAFDKTGTLTLSAPCLAQVRTTGGLDREDALKIGAALESSSVHPIARALCAAAGDSSPRVEEVAHHAGRGVSGGVAGVEWRIGSPAFALGPTQGKSDLEEAIAQARADGLLVAVLADGGGRSALFTFEETLRPGSREIVAELRGAGIRSAVLLSGDARKPVERLARSLGFDEASGEMTTSGKLEWIRSRERSGAGVLYVGDGWNDAPTLAAAGTSVSFGEAAQLARLASDFVILSGDLASLAAARRIARRSTRLLRQNVAWALGYNLLAVPLAAAGLVPPWAAALGMSASSLGVVANALRLRRPSAGEEINARNGARA